MSNSSIELGIGSFEYRLTERKRELVGFVMNEEWWNAERALGDCIGFSAVIDELKYQAELAEVENDD